MGLDGGNSLRGAMGPNGLTGAMDTMLGGKRKSRRSRARSASKSKRARRAGSSYKNCKKGGMGMGFGSVIKEALVPFGLFALQKRTHRRRHAKKERKSRKSRRTRRR